MKHIFLLVITLLTTPFLSSAQSNKRHQEYGYLEVGGLVSSAERTPFWLQANQFGIVPSTGSFGSIRLGIAGSLFLRDTVAPSAHKAFKRPWVLNYAAEGVGNMGKDNQLLLPEAYIQVAHRQIELVAGRRREVIGLADSTLSSGSYSWSGNALPTPKVRFGTRGFAPIGRRGWLAVNAFIAHGWFADSWYMQHSFLHQKSLIVRFGKLSNRVQVYAGINHSAQWAGHSDYLDYHYAVNGQLPGQLTDFPNVLFAIRTNGLDNPRVTSFDYVNLYGNHVGNIDLAADVTLPAATLRLYHQHSFDDASGMFFQNFPDGLTGLRVRFNQPAASSIRINTVLLEFLSTLNQSGPTFYQDNTHTKGADNYFNNGQYQEGWTYQGRVLGTPFITRREDTRSIYRNSTSWAINNNRVQVAHVGLQATIKQRISVLAKVSYSRNYGIPLEPLLGTPTQLSSMLQVGVPTNWLGGSLLAMSIGADSGQLYDNAIGAYVGLRKTIWGTRPSVLSNKKALK
jgi:hypothetical protein